MTEKKLGPNGGKGGRPKGATNKFPSKQKMYDALMANGFEFFKEFVSLYRGAAKEETKERLLMRIAEFLFPKLRPVDLDGKPEESAKEAALEMARQFTEMLSESRKNN